MKERHYPPVDLTRGRCVCLGALNGHLPIPRLRFDRNLASPKNIPTSIFTHRTIIYSLFTVSRGYYSYLQHRDYLLFPQPYIDPDPRHKKQPGSRQSIHTTSSRRIQHEAIKRAAAINCARTTHRTSPQPESLLHCHTTYALPGTNSLLNSTPRHTTASQPETNSATEEHDREAHPRAQPWPTDSPPASPFSSRSSAPRPLSQSVPQCIECTARAAGPTIRSPETHS